MTFLQAIVLGIVQGLTEFIPISSTAHLVFASRIVGLFSDMEQTVRAEQTTAVIAVVQLGTLLAVIIYFARDIINISIAFVRDHLALLTGKRSEAALDETISSGIQPRLSHEAWLGWLVIIGSIPVGVVGLLFKKQIEGTFTKNLWVIATMMIVVALFLLVAEFVGRKRRTMQDLGVRDALAVGGAQCLALIPGASRSGSTIMAGLFAGEVCETAARFSFLLSIPAIAASGLLELKEAIHKLPEGSAVPLAVATVVSGVVGYASIWFLLRFLKTHTTGIFIGYRLIVGATILALLFAGVITPFGERAASANSNSEQRPPLTTRSLENVNANTNNNSRDSVNLKRPSSRKSRSWTNPRPKGR
ncbi:MAG: undecaprenyl-diphosphatase UppP [Acidobacteria bacterium 13_1_20CM_3_53_8]|nr:MAG: undecaprenyl-diphosphatase UppP [Acidobacteria bacterium 13_1_20CM_3_53_8]